MKPLYKTILLLLPAIIVYAWFCSEFNFVQDDAYISYRYVANYLNGDGLVFNIGERVQGYTNFGWVIYLILGGALGIGYIGLSQITGFILGAGVIVLTYLIGRLLFDERRQWYAVTAVYIVALNQSLAYWSPAGLETAAFAFFALLAVYLYLKRSWFLIFAMLMAVWIRPEGAFVTGLLILVEAVEKRRLPLFTIRCAAAALVISLPYVVFLVSYYGSLLPNPFYAKTGFDMAQLSNGMEYVGRFMKHYGFYGVGLIIPLALFKRLSSPERALWLYTVIYTAYIVLVGGDVLKVHRFFLPLFGPMALLIAVSLRVLLKSMKRHLALLILAVVTVVLLGLTYQTPLGFVRAYNKAEKGFTAKMKFMAESIAAADNSDFSVALPTIGIFGYELVGHDIIDMVGLTDSTIARYSEEPIEGMQTTWKEQKHNSRYLLTRAPDYIMFSTGVKPSAPAERALMLFGQFQDCYRNLGWYFQPDKTKDRGTVEMVFKKMKPITGELVPTYPVEFVEYYKRALDYYSAGDQREAIRNFDRAILVSPEPAYIYAYYQKAFSHYLLQEHMIASILMDSVVARDSTIFMAHKELYLYARLQGDTTKAAVHESWLRKMVPWYWPRVKTKVDMTVRRYQQSQR